MIPSTPESPMPLPARLVLALVLASALSGVHADDDALARARLPATR